MKRQKVARRAFTLAEIMIVIVLIALLAGFLLPAVINSLKESRVAACRAEIKALEMAIDSFHNDFGFYPPTDMAYNPATGNFDGDPYWAADDGDLINRDYGYSEALFQCLCNRFTRGVGDGLPSAGLSFRGRQVRLLGGAPVNAGPYYEFDTDRLSDLDGDEFPELCDIWGKPYIYVPNQDYTSVVVEDYWGAGDVPVSYYGAGALVPNDDATDPDPTLVAEVPPGRPDGSAIPELLNNHYNRFRFQLVSCGPDGWTPGLQEFDNNSNGTADGYPYLILDLVAPINAYPVYNPALVGTDTDLSAPRTGVGHTKETADDINNW